MQVKVFEAENMAAALKKVKASLGPEALILSTRTVRRNGLGLLGRPVTEITAAIDSPPPAGLGYQAAPEPSRRPAPAQQFRQRVEDELTYDEIWRQAVPSRPIEADPKRQAAGEIAIEVQPGGEAREIATLQEELDELKNLMRAMGSEIRGLAGPRPGQAEARKEGASDDGRQRLLERLACCGIAPALAAEIADQALRALSARQLEDDQLVERFLKNTLAGVFEVTGSLLSRLQDGPRRIALIGPTGVGKTTTIAKLAAGYLARHGRSAALITIDTYRIAAVEQLKVYGTIMRLPVEVVTAPEQMATVLARHADKDVLFIDTAGRSPRDAMSLDDLRQFLRPEYNIETHLVLAATAAERNLLEAARCFEQFAPQSYIFTKLDESLDLGALVNLQARKRRPVSYLTNGQRVPEDILLADPSRLAELVLEAAASQSGPSPAAETMNFDFGKDFSHGGNA